MRLFVFLVTLFLLNEVKSLSRQRRRIDDAHEIDQGILGNAFIDAQQLEKLFEDTEAEERLSMQQMNRNILSEAREIAQFEDKPADTFARWEKIQTELHSALRLIRGSLERFYSFHQSTCAQIDHFIRNVTTRYDNELSILQRISLPNTERFIKPIDSNEIAWKSFLSKITKILDYINIHHNSMQTALDVSHQYTRNLVNSRRRFLHQSRRRLNIYQPQIQITARMQEPQYVFNTHCDVLTSDHQCMDGISHATHEQAALACGCS